MNNQHIARELLRVADILTDWCKYEKAKRLFLKEFS